MTKSIGEIVFTDLPELFSAIVDTFANILSWFTTSIGELFNQVVTSLDVPEWLVSFIDDLIQNNKFFASIWDVPLLALMLGSALGLYLVYQLLIWILNIIT